MLGLSTALDAPAIRALAPAANTKSHKFASQLSGRFFVSGISGGFEKHAKLERAGWGGEGGPRKTRPNVSQAIFLQRQAQEIQQDAARLLQLEAQLRDIQRGKELRRQRERSRRRKKLEYESACKIQRWVRYFFGTKMRGAADAIVSFIRMARARQAVSIGAWAATTIHRFALHATTFFLEKRKKKRLEEQWLEAARLARTEKSNGFVGACIKQGFLQAIRLRVKEHSEREKERERVSLHQKATPKKGAKATPTKKAATSPKGGAASPGPRFFLTEFDSGEGPRTNSSSPAVGIVASSHLPVAARGTAIQPVLNVNNAMSSLLFDDEGAGGEEEEEEEDNEEPGEEAQEEQRRMRIAGLHEERLTRMQRERELRLAKLEQTKRIKEAQALAKAREEALEKVQREDAKRLWLANYEAERVANARAYGKSVADRERQQRAERASEKRELERMYAHDKYYKEGGRPSSSSLETRRRPAVPRLATRTKASSPSLEEVAKKKEEEAEAVELRRQQQEELMLRSAAALKMRLAKQKHKEALEKQVEAERERVKAMQKAKVAAEAQIKLMRALELRQLALDRGNGKDGDTTTKLGKKSRKKRDGELDEIPLASLAQIQEWNYSMLPANGTPLADDPEAGEDDAADLNLHHFADMLDDDASTYDWLEDGQVDGLGLEEHGVTDGGGNLEDSKEADDEAVEEDNEEMGEGVEDLIRLIVHPKDQRPINDEREANDENHGNVRIFKSKDITNISGSTNVKKHKPGLVAKKKTDASSVVSSIASSLGQANYRPVKIPSSLKDTPYYAAYVKSGMPSASKVASRSAVKGKVGRLLEMVAKARLKLGKRAPEVPESVEGLAVPLKGPRFALSPRWQPPSLIELFNTGNKRSVVKKAAVKATSESRTANPYDYDLNEAQRSLESFEQCADPNLLDGPEYGEEREEDDKEQQLNAECEVLRQRLEQRMGVSAMNSVAPRGPESKEGPGMTAADVISAYGGRFDDSMAAKLFQQWAEEDGVEEGGVEEEEEED